MPPKGYKAPPKITAEDCGDAAELCNAAAINLAIIAKRHVDIPKLLAALSFAQEAVEILYQRRDALADSRQTPSSVVPPDVDRPGEARG
jgi:hypothetical protein